MTEDRDEQGYRRRHNQWMVFWTAIGAVATIGSAVVAVYLSTAAGDHDRGADAAVTPIGTATSPPPKSPEPPPSESRSPSNSPPSSPSPPSPSASDVPLAVSETRLAGRLKESGFECRTISDRAGRARKALASLVCTDGRADPGDNVDALSFGSLADLKEFMDLERQRARDSAGTPGSYLDSYTWQTGNRVGEEVYFYGNVGQDSWEHIVVAAYEEDEFVARYGQYFAILADDPDKGRLRSWWSGKPI